MQTLLIAQGTDEFREALADAFRGKYQVSVCADGCTALELLRTLKPNILILDLMLPALDGVTLLQEIVPEVPPVVLATTRFASEYVLQTVKDLGVGYLMMLPCSVNAVEERIADMVRHADRPYPSRLEPQALVAASLSALGVPVNLDGYNQLRIAVPLFAQDPQQSLCKELYPAVAALCGCSDGRQVERSIRNAIQTAWMQRDDAVWAEYFPKDPQGHILRPSNKVFISCFANVLMSKKREIYQRENKDSPISSFLR